MASPAGVGVPYKRPTTALVVLCAALVIVSAVAAIGWVHVIRDGEPVGPLSSPLIIRSCSPEAFAEGLSCLGDRPPSPGVVLYPHGAVTSAGRVILSSESPVSYELRVEWVNIDTGLRYARINTPIQYEAGRNEPYELTWDIPATMVLALGSQAPGADLGRWRIVGTATPFSERYETFAWDVTETFDLVAE